MSSSNYSYNYPYQQSSAQQYSSHQTAPPTNPTTKSTRQYQKAPSAAPSQTADYMSYSGPSYGTSSTGYGAAQDNWSGSPSDYGTARDNGSRAAEVLRNMSNTGYAATTSAPSQSGFTAANAASAHYTSGRSPQVQAQPPQGSHAAYGQTQARPRSINTKQAQSSASRGLSSPATAAGYPSQRAAAHYPQQQQRTASPSQVQYGQNSATASSRPAGMAAAGTSQSYGDYSHRHLPETDASRSSHTAPHSNSYTPRLPVPIVQPPVSAMPEPYTGPSTTVDPTAVYDPWPEYQRQRAIKDAERAEKERKEEEVRLEEERVEEEERKRKETDEQARQAQLTASQPKPRTKKAQKQQTPAPVAPPAEASGSSAAASDLEAEIRAMMAKMRELNSKDPQMLARIWEEERKAKAPINKSPTITTKPAPQPVVVPPVQVPTPPIANQRKKATPRDSFSTPTAKPVTPAPVQAVPMSAPAAATVRAGGTTIWPAEKKLELARAAAHYLTTHNPDRPIEGEQVIQMLDGNPSYVELCEQLEQMGFQLNRSIFAKSLLSAVPDVNSASRKTALQVPPAAASKIPAPPAVMKHPAPPAVMKNRLATPVAPSPRYAAATASPMNRPSYPSFPDDDAMAAPSQIPVAEMVPIKPELKPPANKEQAARKRNLSDLVDLTQLDDEEDMGPPLKRFNTGPMYTYGSPHPHINDAMDVDVAPVSNFPTAGMSAPTGNFPTASTPAPVANEPTFRAVVPIPATELRYRAIVEPLDKKKALRRNTYNPATIARDVLLACGRHPSERHLNQHLDILKVNIPQITYEADLSTIKWGLIDPGSPPPGYFKASTQALTEDADDEDDSEDEDMTRWGSSHADARAQALPEATNPFIKQKQRGRPPRHSLPNTTTPSTPKRQASSAKMSATAPRPAASGTGYSAFREVGPDGNPLPKKKGRPVGWRKAIHGSAAAQQRSASNGHAGKYGPEQPSTLRNVSTGEDPILISSRSPSVANHAQYQSFKCKWQNCKAELHNLETLQLHVFKVHKKDPLRSTLECLWDGCGKHVTSFDPMSNMSLERHVPLAFAGETTWREHLQQSHFDPLSWEQGDGPAGGLSDAHDSEAYLSDAQGRRVTPRITASPADYESITSVLSGSMPCDRGRPAKDAQQQEARDAQDRLVSQKRRMGGPGMDRGGATLVNDKRRRGLVDSDGAEEEYVDAED
ncbi:hypothetical protein C7974DRAFT_64537 [Boeremia exigua]|uniref:uncharacterized protein n=1 Tax=Boeremia exigua TaxID=749465 RepID=UPI001E8ED0A7|nr:uncharacterized protein C7974DRAFT_64537 [Boeremia exigua]KAH6615344.1 hypothetical protein C7974DRAFT_64537 [Boeremia exigua]